MEFDEDLLHYAPPYDPRMGYHPAWAYRPSRLSANPDFGNYRFRKGYTAEVTLDDGETVVLAADSRTKTYRTHYSPFHRYSFSWIDRLLRLLWIDRLLGLNVDSVKKIRTKSFVLVTAHLLPR